MIVLLLIGFGIEMYNKQLDNTCAKYYYTDMSFYSYYPDRSIVSHLVYMSVRQSVLDIYRFDVNHIRFSIRAKYV